MMNEMIKNVRAKSPIVLNVANNVTPQHVADGINFIGGSPIMIADPLEAKELTSLAGAVTLNLGSTSPIAQMIMLAVGEKANAMKIPVVFDPVAVGASSIRTERANQLLRNVKVDVVRGNIGEVAALAGVAWNAHGIDAGEGDGDQVEIAKQAAQKLNCKVVVSGPTDIVTDGETVYLIQNNAPLLATNVGMGDVLDGILAVFLSQDDSLETLAYATGVLPVAASMAMEKYPVQPASFLTETFDNLATIDDAQFKENLKIELR
ncbi:hydroxyethylthiazole kinase [Fructilactobacillus sp. Tb1]|uniref:hydroxyethylthiazole kinase n=1 Tax=Fructilactobacillus sp. Tb1 TaxID=3422304 RepID=UPI003D292978